MVRRGLTGHTGRSVTVDLGFLGEGDFRIETFVDGVNADKYGRDYRREVRMLGNERSLTVRMAPGGGFAARIEPAK